MTAAVALCVISTLGFCLCARALIFIASLSMSPMAAAKRGVSLRAWRMTRTYGLVSMFILTAVAAVGALHGFIELFTARF